jgi:polar amino acid transport system substrate-binding protein
VIEGVFVVAADSPIATTADVDQAHVRIGVKQGSAYDLFLSRNLQHASVVGGDEGVDVFAARGLEVGAGIRQPVTEYVASHSGLRLLEDPFMEIRQAMGTAKDRDPDALTFLRSFVEDVKASGFVADSLRRAGLPAQLLAAAG